MQAKQLHLAGNMEEAKRKGTLAKKLSVAGNICYPVTVMTGVVAALVTGLAVSLGFLI